MNYDSAVIVNIQTKSASFLGYMDDCGYYVLIDKISSTQYHITDPIKAVK